MDVSDSGAVPNTGSCRLIINLFALEDTVTADIEITQGEFDASTLQQLLTNLLNLEVDVTNFSALNATFYKVELVGFNNGEIILADSLAFLLNSLTDQQLLRLEEAGLNIMTIQSNTPVTTPSGPPGVPARPIPTWAVVLIVVLNSVIIIGFLLAVLGVTWKRFRR